MTKKEFGETIKILENTFDKEYTTEQLDIMFNELKKLNTQRFKLVCSKLIKTNKFLPKLADIIDADREIPRKQEEKPYKNCEICGGTGYITYTKKIENNEYMYGARCICGNMPSYKGKEYYLAEAKELDLL